MSRTPGEIPLHYQTHETDLTRELIAYFQQVACSIQDPERLELLLDELCVSEETPITKPQAEARAQQIQFVRNLLRDRPRVELLQDFYDHAMEVAYAVGGEFYVKSATRLTALQADAQALLEDQSYHELAKILAEMKRIGDRGNELKQAAAEVGSCRAVGASRSARSQRNPMMLGEIKENRHEEKGSIQMKSPACCSTSTTMWPHAESPVLNAASLR